MSVSKDVAEPTKKDYMHLDDFLNMIEAEGRRELAAAFALRAKAQGWVKREVAEWRKDLEAFAGEVPR